MTQYFHSGTACLVMLALASTVAYAAESDQESGLAENTASDQAAVAKKTSPTELSVAPLDQIERPADRPVWLDKGDVLDGPENSLVIVTSPADSPDQCEEELEIMKRAEVASFIKLITKSDRIDFYPVNKEWIDDRLVTNSYAGTVKQGDMEMYEQAVELTFDLDTKTEIANAWETEVVKDRLGLMGFFTFVGTSLLVCLSMFLCMLSRRTCRTENAEVGSIPPVSDGTVAFATMLNGNENGGTYAASQVSSWADRSLTADSDVSKPTALVAPIICTAVYLLTTPGGYFWPKWVWFGCILVPLFASWSDKSRRSTQ